MDQTAELWLLGIIVVPTIGWAIRHTVLMSKLRDDMARLLDMHENPENTGFGTVGIAQVIEENTKAIQALTHYVVWLAKQSGSTPPPPLEKG